MAGLIRRQVIPSSDKWQCREENIDSRPYGQRCVPSEEGDDKYTCESVCTSPNDAILTPTKLVNAMENLDLRFPVPHEFLRRMDSEEALRKEFLVFRAKNYEKVVAGMMQLVDHIGGKALRLVLGNLPVGQYILFVGSYDERDIPRMRDLAERVRAMRIDQLIPDHIAEEVLHEIDVTELAIGREKRLCSQNQIFVALMEHWSLEFALLLRRQYEELIQRANSIRSGLDVVFYYSRSHANCLIFDYNKKALYHFEPNINVNDIKCLTAEDLQRALIEMGSTRLRNFKIHSTTNVCPWLGKELGQAASFDVAARARESEDYPEFTGQYYEDNNCTIWSLMMAAMYVLNNRLEPEQIFSHLLAVKYGARQIMFIFAFYLNHLLGGVEVEPRQSGQLMGILTSLTHHSNDLEDMYFLYYDDPEKRRHIQFLLSCVVALRRRLNPLQGMTRASIMNMFDYTDFIENIPSLIENIRKREDSMQSILQKKVVPLLELLRKLRNTPAGIDVVVDGFLQDIEKEQQNHAIKCTIS